MISKIKLLVSALLLLCLCSCASCETSMIDVQEFLSHDTTDQHEYKKWYTCGHYSRELARNASNLNISMGSAILGNNPVFRGYENHIINYIEINNTLYFIEPQTDSISRKEDVFKVYKYIRLYPDGTQVPSFWKYNLAYDLVRC